jgi:cell division protein FtsW
LALLAAVLVPGLSREVLGARRSFYLGPINFQPSEFAKLAIIFYLADAFARRKEKMANITPLLAPIAIAGLVILLIEKEPDLGSTIVVGGSVIGMLFIGGARIWHLAGLTVIGFVLAASRVMNESYRVKRMLAFINPWEDPQGMGYQIIQSFIALGSGGFYGLGLGESRQKFFYLPEKFTDFIFAITGEELGFLYGTLPIVLLFIFLLYKGLRVAANSKDTFKSLLAGGLTFQIVLQAFINMGVVVGVLPCTGIPLPFVSFGGSSLVFTLISLGFILNVSGDSSKSYSKDKKEKDKGKEKGKDGDKEMAKAIEDRADLKARANARPRFTSSGSIAGFIPTVPDIAAARKAFSRNAEIDSELSTSQSFGDSKCGLSSQAEEREVTYTRL